MSKRYDIEVLPESRFEDYHQVISNCQDALFYYDLSFLNLLDRNLFSETIILLAYQGSKPVGALPFCVSKPSFAGRVVNSLPFFGSNGGVIVIDDYIDDYLKIASSLLNRFEKVIESIDCCSYTLISNPFVPKFKEAIKNLGFENPTDGRIGQITNIGKDQGELLASFSGQRRRNIKKALASNIEIESSNRLEDFNFLADVHKENISSIGGRFKTRPFFHSVLESVPKANYSLKVAKMDGKAIAALLLFYQNKTVEYYTPATLHDYRTFQPSSLLIFEAMKEARSQGFRWWNWGGTWETQQGVYGFKKKWNAIDWHYNYYTKVIRKDVLRRSFFDVICEYEGFYVAPKKFFPHDEK